MMLMHESHVFQLPVETKFQVYDPRIVYFYFILFFFNATYVVTILTCINIILNRYSSRTRRIWADIYKQRGRYYQLISGKGIREE